jgi:DnaJ family protein A protein 5
LASRREIQDEAEDEEALEVEAEFWNKVQVATEEESVVQEGDDLGCAVCNKPFRSKGARDSHLNSKKHKEEVERLRHELSLTGEVLPEELDVKPEIVAQAGRRKSNKKKVKKGVKQDHVDEMENNDGDDKTEGEEKGEEDKVAEEEQNNDVKEDEVEAEVPAASQPGQSAKKPKKPRRAKKKDGVVAAAPKEPAPESDDSEDNKKKSRRARRDKGKFDDVNRCLTCRAEFITRSALFRHLEDTNHAKPK